MSNSSPEVDNVIELMNGMVAKDGGQIALQSYDAPSGTVTVDYKEGVNEECITCAITPEMVNMFLLESFKSHGVPVNEVIVKPMG